jgi:hypothetical protein
MLQISFATAVLRVINIFRQNQTDFSAYDVTREIRVQANSGDIQIQGLPVEPVDGVNTNRIDHEDVRELVIELYTNGLITDYRKDRGNANGQNYIKYVYVNPSAPVVGGNVSNSAVASNPVPTAQTPQKFNLTFKAYGNSAGAPKYANVGRILAYVSQKKAKGGTPTLKSIQSALKGFKITTKEIESLVTSNGYKVTLQAGLKPSLAVVD